MSYILDALKKSQKARRNGSVAIPSGSVHRIVPSMPDNGLWFTAGLILLMGVTVAVLLFWRSTADQTLVPQPQMASHEAATQLDLDPAKNETSGLLPPGKIPEKSYPVHDLAEEAKVSVPGVVSTLQKAVEIKPDREIETGNSKQQLNSLPPILPISDETPLLQQMPAEFQNALPDMAVTIHVYSPLESQRILFINNREYHKGDRINGKISIDEIVPDGVVLSFQGERFKLERPR